MIALTSAQGRTYGVFGLARSGTAVLRALQAGGGKAIAWDDSAERRAEGEALGARVLPLERWPWEEITSLVLSPGVPFTHPEPHPVVRAARDHRVEVIGDVELFIREVTRSERDGPRIVVVTGTNGKSTTTALITHLLKSAGVPTEMGGNIGRAVFDLPPPKAGMVYVLELSSFQIDLTPGLKPTVSVLLNISPDHIDRHGSLENYAAIKRRVFKGLGKAGTGVIGVDDPLSAEICTAISSNGVGRVVPISVGKVPGQGVAVIDGVLFDGLATPATEVLDLRRCPALPGSHNWQNAAAAYAAARALTGNVAALVRGLESFPGLPHRMEQVAQIGPVLFVNDSKATNADAAARALACYENIFWIAGGKAKEGGIASLAPFFPRIAKAYLIGTAAQAFAQTLGGQVPYEMSGELARAVDAAHRDALAIGAPSPVVLLSPACASFDQFRDFEDRGDQFRALVQARKPDKGDAAA